MTKKMNKFRKNVRDFVDCDYKHKLNDEEKAFMDRFENEYYSNAHGESKSLHREAFGADYEASIKKEMYDNTNSVNRCVQSIAGKSSYMYSIDEVVDFLKSSKDEGSLVKELLSTNTPKEVLNTLMEDAVELIDNYVLREGKSTLSVLTDYTFKVNTLFTEVRKIASRDRKISKTQKEQSGNV